MLKTTIFAALLLTSATTIAQGYLSKADTMQTPSGVYNATTKQQETAPMSTEFTAEDAAFIATKISDLLEYNELHAGTAALLHDDNVPFLNAAVDAYVGAKAELEMKQRALVNELLRVTSEAYQ